jgi:hypothetical protein
MFLKTPILVKIYEITIFLPYYFVKLACNACQPELVSGSLEMMKRDAETSSA